MTTFDFDQLQFFRQEWAVAPSINIQYQSTGVSSLPSLDKIELRRKIWGVIKAVSDDRCLNLFLLLGNSTIIRGAY